MNGSFRIRDVLVAPNVVLAPMSGVTDSPFRRIVRAMNPGAVGLFVSELVSVEALLRDNRRSYEMLRFRPEERPISLQLFGAQPDRMAEGARIVEELGADVVDINCGCPAPKVVKNGGGAELLRRAENLRAVLAAVRRAVRLPVTLKIRSGWDEGSRNAVEVARMAEGEGAEMIAVHGRTRVQLYKGAADWEIIARVKEAVGIPVVGSGDVRDGATLDERLRRTGVDGVMVGRAAARNPWVFRRIAEERAGLPPYRPGTDEVIAYVRQLVAFLLEDLPERALMGRMRGLVHRMSRGFQRAAALRDAVSRARSPEELLGVLDAHGEGRTDEPFVFEALESEGPPRAH